MDSYKEKLCEFLTSTVENFNYSKQIFDLYENGEIKQFIIKKHLDKFLDNVKNLINQSSVGWKSSIISRNDNPDYIHLILSKIEWDGFSISWDVISNDIGICYYDENIDRGWKSRINGYLKTTDRKEIINSKQDYKEWLWWEDFTFDFEDYDLLFSITPIKSELTSIDISNQLMKYSSKYEKQIKHILSLKEK